MNRIRVGAVLCRDQMNEWVGRWPDSLVSADASLDREFEERLRDSSGLAFSIAYGVLRNRSDAEEVAQDAFARAFRRFRQLRDRDRFRSWLTRMTWRLAIDRWRTDRRRTARELAIAPEPWRPSIEDEAVARERSKHVWLAIDKLPEKLRLVVVLSAIEGHDTREVADLLDVPEGTVKSRLFSARKMLAGELRWLVSDSPKR
jgi:RNA polymerase sigma-70 factor (ECF subfamily)